MTVVLRPRRLRRVCQATAGGVLAVFGVIAVLLPTRAAADRHIGVADQLSFFLIGVLLAVGVLALARPRVRADHTGIGVRNVFAERRYPWAVVLLVHLPDSAPWAQLELRDDEQVALLALQANDGADAVQGVAELERLRTAATRETGHSGL
jgi:hypothetical protein